jgi:hypothetical protein
MCGSVLNCCVYCSTFITPFAAMSKPIILAAAAAGLITLASFFQRKAAAKSHTRATEQKRSSISSGEAKHKPFVIRGLFAATFTPLNEDGNLKLQIIDRYAQELAAQGISGVFICGTTGESLSLTADERRALAEAWVRAGKRHKLVVVVHVGADSVKDAADLAQHAESIGANAISAIPPVFFKTSSIPNLVQTMASIASAAPRTPFYFYHFPDRTGQLASGLDVFLAQAAVCC